MITCWTFTRKAVLELLGGKQTRMVVVKRKSSKSEALQLLRKPSKRRKLF